MSDEESIENKVDERFISQDGKTYFGSGEFFGDFTLKVLGELEAHTKKDAGQWVCVCSTISRGILESRTIVLNAGVFDTKQRFMDGLRCAYGGGTFILGSKVSSACVRAFVAHLKADFENQDEPRVFRQAEYIGYQGGSYWLISSKMHIEGKAVLAPSEHRYLVTDPGLDQYGLVINTNLLKFDSLKQAYKRFFTLSSCFGQNTAPFQLASAFTVARILRNATASRDVWAESSLGMIFSETKCVGKSLSLSLLALGQGIPNRVHLMFLSGGNQLLCGTSAKKMQQSLTYTNGVVLIDDPDINKQFAEFLLQVQGRLMSGSNKEGMSAPRATALISSNSPEIARIVGRVIRFNYTGPREGVAEHDSWILENSMMPFMEENKGLLLAWAILYFDAWEKVCKDCSTLIKSILERVFEQGKPQQRWLKGVAAVVLANTMTRLSVGLTGATAKVIQYLIDDTPKEPETSECELTPLQKLESCVLSAVKNHNGDILTWLNPTVSVVNNKGNKVPAVAIAASKADSFANISHSEMKACYQSMVQQAATIGVYFNKSTDATITELSKRQGTSQKRAYRIPFMELSPYTAAYIKYASGMIEEEPQEETASQTNNTNVASPEVSEEDRSALADMEKMIDLAIKDCEKVQAGSSRPKPSAVVDVGVSEELTPRTKKRYLSMTPKKRKAFDMGLEFGRRKLSEKDVLEAHPSGEDEKDSSTPGNATEVLESGSSGEVDNTVEAENSVRKQLFADGTYGVMPKQAPVPAMSSEDKKDNVSTRTKSYRFCICKKKKSKTEEDSMLICETRKKGQCPGKGYYHLSCLGLTELPKEKKWYCNSCKDERKEKGTKK